MKIRLNEIHNLIHDIYMIFHLLKKKTNIH